MRIIRRFLAWLRQDEAAPEERAEAAKMRQDVNALRGGVLGKQELMSHRTGKPDEF